MRYLNIHTHRKVEHTAWRSIQSLRSDFHQVLQPGAYSIGLHPWYLDVHNAQGQFGQLERFAEEDDVLAIGECGLDKVCNTDWNLQVDYFIRQTQLAIKIKKPLIIHCVRAYDEVLKILKENSISVPVVFHGFNKRTELANKILDQGYYLSFGKHLLMDAYDEVFKEIPLDKIFLETDDDSIAIETVYRKAAEMKQLDLVLLTEQISENYRMVFGGLKTTQNE